MSFSALEILTLSLKEDAPEGDITCLSIKDIVPSLGEKSIGYVLAKQDLIFSGIDFFVALKEIHKHYPLTDPIDVELFFKAGDEVYKGQKIAALYGNTEDLVLVERTLLNIVGRLCGIATLTSQFVKQVSHTQCQILDTRKTTPLYRKFEKQAVVDGGGKNHRMNLSDAIMLKENHLQAIPLAIGQTINHIKKRYPDKKIIVEVNSLEQVQSVAECMVEQILLDNMSNEEISDCLTVIPKHILTEASGNMTLNRVAKVAETGVNYISIGKLTHSAEWADISFLIE